MSPKQEGSNQIFQTRPPVVVVLGHVDHGKTQLLDTIRKTNVIAKESGGITQHIGAYQVEVEGKTITFLDTPGHEAFSAIRSRGTRVADIAILVVAADESVKPQTKEAIKIIKEAEIPVIVAINKIDKDGSNPAKVKQDLASEEILVEEWGGKVPAIEISARKGTNIKEMLDMILLVTELEELKQDLILPAEGVIIESNLDKRRGYIATALVQKGILRIGDWVVVGTVIGKVKSLEDFMGQSILEAFPSQPVRITGWNSAPQIGKPFIAAYSKDESQRIQEGNMDLSPLAEFFKGSPVPETVDPNKKILNIIIKTDVSSSIEAIETSLKAIPAEEVTYKVLDYGIGNVSEADIKTAMGTKALIIGFRVETDTSAIRAATREGVTVANFDIIYELIEYIRKSMGSLLDPEITRNIFGKLKILALFKKEGKNQILGGRVTSGKLVRGSKIDVVSKEKSILLGRLTQLQQDKEDSSEVREGLEAGMKIELTDPNLQIQVGDILESYEEEKVSRIL